VLITNLLAPSRQLGHEQAMRWCGLSLLLSVETMDDITVLCPGLDLLRNNIGLCVQAEDFDCL